MSPASGVPPSAAAALFGSLVLRDLRLAARRRVDALLPLAFFTVAVSLFPLGVGPEAQTLRQIAPGVVWVCALLAAMLSVTQLYAGDHADGSLEQMLLSSEPAVLIATAKALAHWLLTGLPLVLAAPVFGLLFDMGLPAVLALVTGLLLGTPILSLLGGLGAALTLGLRSGGVLLILLIVPLCIPALIFGAGAVSAVEAGLDAQAHYSLLGALLIFTALLAPWATAAALRIAVE
jgi:heme exporter protein B